MSKKCTKCGEIKMLTEFVKHKRYADGHYSQCKICTRKQVIQWQKDNPEKKNEIRTRYRENNREHIREMDRDYYVENHEKRLEHARKAQSKYYRTEKGQKKYKEQGKIVRKNNPVQARARSLLSNAVCEGKIIRPSTCSLCGSEEFMIEAHHPDYSKPLDVIWLCRPCHNVTHRKIKSRRERLSEKTMKVDAIVCSSEETASKKSEEISSPSKDGQ